MDTYSTLTNTKTNGSRRASSSPPLSSPSSPSSHTHTPPPPPTIVMSPCAACKILRRRCADRCILAPYFPPTEPAKFTIAHRVFGASNIIKFLQDLPESQRADAVTSMVYEASARIRDPVYGCAGAICQLQKQIDELQAQLAKARAELVNMQCQQANLMALLRMEMSQFSQQLRDPSSIDNVDVHMPQNSPSNTEFLDDNYLSSMAWEPLWTIPMT